ncbi:MAG: tetratricopeptide repeat protein [Planctomycetota bacterium]|nr:tetratricopeptide repeat protein [Planctomycetota bacterium]
MTSHEALELAVAHQQAGRLADAEAVYRQILDHDPSHAQAMHLLGTLAHAAGRLDLAADLMNRSIALQPRVPEFYLNMGVVLLALGRIDEAVTAYRQAVALNTNSPEAHFGLGGALVCAKDIPGAEQCFRRALELRPDYAEAINNLGNIFNERRELEFAQNAYKQAIALRPDYADAYNNLGNAYFDDGQFDRAEAAFRGALAQNPNHVDATNNLGRTFFELGRLDDALACFHQACSLQPDYVDGYINIANVRYQQCRLDESITYVRKALELNPGSASAHWNLGLTLLCRGDFSEGWKEAAWRSRVKELGGTCREFSQPIWDGGDLQGSTILLHAEQGFGDTLQFIRYLPMVQAKGGKIVVDCRPELMNLLQASFQVDQWCVTDQPLPHFDLHCPLLSLPMAFATTLATIPNEFPYLQPDEATMKVWQSRLKDVKGLKIGLVWAGRPEHRNDRNRSIALSLFAPLMQVPGLTLVSLQKFEAKPVDQQLPALTPPPGMELIDWTSELSNFADTAALISSLDLVIGVDTSVVHLAGALGKPVWVLLPFAPDWRWMLDRDDSPWYPTMRLFRQRQRGDWNRSMEDIVGALKIMQASR